MKGIIQLIVFNFVAIFVIGSGNQFTKAKNEACKGIMADYKQECLNADEQINNGNIGFTISSLGYGVFLVGILIYLYQLFPLFKLKIKEIEVFDSKASQDNNKVEEGSQTSKTPDFSDSEESQKNRD